MYASELAYGVAHLAAEDRDLPGPAHSAKLAGWDWWDGGGFENKKRDGEERALWRRRGESDGWKAAIADRRGVGMEICSLPYISMMEKYRMSSRSLLSSAE